jgi:hypothetical protein
MSLKIKSLLCISDPDWNEEICMKKCIHYMWCQEIDNVLDQIEGANDRTSEIPESEDSHVQRCQGMFSTSIS